MTVDVGSIASTGPGRDSSFREAALQVSQLPKVTFTFTNPVTLDAVLTGHGGQVTGSIPITFSDFGVLAPSLGFVTVESAGSIEFLLNLTQG